MALLLINTHIYFLFLNFNLSCILKTNIQNIIVIDRNVVLYTTLHIRYSTIINSGSLMSIFCIDLLNNKFCIVYRYLINCDYSVDLIVLLDSSIIESISNIYQNASWYEREISEMFGIKFINSTDSRNLLLPYNFNGNPLRKNWCSSYGFSLDSESGYSI